MFEVVVGDIRGEGAPGDGSGDAEKENAENQGEVDAKVPGEGHVEGVVDPDADPDVGGHFAEHGKGKDNDKGGEVYFAAELDEFAVDSLLQSSSEEFFFFGEFSVVDIGLIKFWELI